MIADEHGVGRHACKCAVLAEHDAAQVVVVADTREHEFGAVRAARPPYSETRCSAFAKVRL